MTDQDDIELPDAVLSALAAVGSEGERGLNRRVGLGRVLAAALGEEFEEERVGGFVIECRIGAGGMGEVFRARDPRGEQRVAVKIVKCDSPSNAQRFLREANILADLRHPAIVRYISHGTTKAGELYLAMEWLDGQTLATRLGGASFEIEEVVRLARRLADALAHAHTRGVVHRDLKPANVFLPEGRIEEAKLLDFGIASLIDVTRMTRTGELLGTASYMAPEQAKGPNVSPSADVHALGCIVFEALTGTPPFRGRNLLAVLAKLLFEVAPRVSEFRPDVPPALDDLVARMLAKEPQCRPQDGAALAAELAHLGDALVGSPSSIPSLEALGPREQRHASLVVVGWDPDGPDSSTKAESPATSAIRLDQTARAYDGRVLRLSDGSAVIVFDSAVASDAATAAARCAMLLHDSVGDRPVAVVTGRSDGNNVRIGPAIDHVISRMVVRSSCSFPYVLVDDVTAALLGSSFDLRVGDAGVELHGEEARAPFGRRKLLGQPTICVGRARELRLLTELWDECVEVPMGQAVLVTGVPGIGKSRLGAEMLNELAAMEDPPEIWAGRCDPMRGGSSLAVLADALRSGLDIRTSDPLERQRQTVRTAVDLRVVASDRERVTFFLGELVGAGFSGEGMPAVQAARRDPQIMADQMRRAWIDFLSASCKRRPVLLVLEDLHWGDPASVAFVDAALDACKDAPWMVLALARPEVDTTFPELWSRRRFHPVRLSPLTRRACEQLVRHTLGQAAGDETVALISERSDGNAFYLEELIRAVARGQVQALPKTVLAMVEARLRDLSATQRRVLRAASVFGEVFWKGGVEALAGSTAGRSIDSILSELMQGEVVEPCSESRLRGETQLRFRHALLREGAYSTLTDSDRTLGHRLAGEWLEQAGEGDVLSLAEHFRLGGEPARASTFYLRAAEHALRAADTAGALRRAELGFDGADDPTRASLLGLTCEAHFWRMELAEAASVAGQVMSLEPTGSQSWVQAAAAMLAHSISGGDINCFMTTLQRLLAAEFAPETVGAAAYGLATAAACLDVTGQFEAAKPCLQRIREIVDPVAEREPIGLGWMHVNYTYRESWLNEDPERGLGHARLASESFRAAGHRRGVLLAEVYGGMNLWSLGRFKDAEATLRATLEADEELALASSGRTFYLVGVLADAGALDVAHDEAARMLEVGRTRDPVHQGRGHWALAEVLRRGSAEAKAQAEAEARAAVDLLASAYLPLDHMAATVTLAAVQLAQGNVAALHTIDSALELYRKFNAWGFRGSLARLVHAEALAAFGPAEQARAVLADAAGRLRSQAKRMRDPELARSFLERVPENVRTLALAAKAGV